ncbi:cytochrome-c peroxidase [Chitinimonas koreensis]|uniref:cytochrome-c peroxidase n=1 Tax=Chitinimonas koreensis TaxID=356302 RepID=UPI0004076CB8|nr:cytochrome c peroxidase [Chitinimonas koreensis]QNM97027.1 c-type cytochrome [Chitinimonas koreensis]
MENKTIGQLIRRLTPLALLGILHCTLLAAVPPPPRPPVPPPPAKPTPTPQPTPTPAGALSAAASLGRAIFFDPALSASGRQSCATCHAPARGYAAPGNQPTQFGGASLELQGLRNTPSLMYAHYTPAFSASGAAQAPGQPARTGVAAGGFLLDGRAASLAAQAQLPFTAPFEMANRSSAEVLQRLRTRPYYTQFGQVFGAAATTSGDAALAALGRAIAAFETEDPSFHPFSSKFDAVTRGQAAFSAREASGQRLFNDAAKGNCAACHTATAVAGVPALFTDHSYRALGVPRNFRIVYNRDDTVLPAFAPANGINLGAPNHPYYDMGLCGPLRTDLSRNTALCGQFKVPTLRNVAIKQTYFHNGVFDRLGDVVGFYATREADPTRWYRRADGSPDQRYNDLPAAYAANVPRGFAPFQPRPTLTAAEVRDVIAFLCTLTDGFDPRNPAAQAVPAQCL